MLFAPTDTRVSGVMHVACKWQSLRCLSQVEELKNTFSKDELKEKLKDVYILGIRSATDVTADVLEASKRLLAIGCFCIGRKVVCRASFRSLLHAGTNQVDLNKATSVGVPVFNSPFSNSRSVAELIIGQVIALARRLGEANAEMHAGVWKKYTTGRNEVRGKTLGIVGYGNIGTQLSVLAEGLGLRVIFYDTVVKLALGNAQSKSSLNALLAEADFVTLHVPLAEDTKGMIGAAQIALMKKGGFLLNASRGNVVVIEAVTEAIKSGHLAGAYFDVYPKEPKDTVATFDYSELRALPNVYLTPHIGGATHEAQEAIGREVSAKLLDFVNHGSSDGAVNFPKLRWPRQAEYHRIVNVHSNRPGVLKELNNILSEFNITTQLLGTHRDIGYLICDVDRQAGKEIKARIVALEANIKTRILY
jgi:D-3-phosphoglycerate dehydrogenase